MLTEAGRHTPPRGRVLGKDEWEHLMHFVHCANLRAQIISQLRIPEHAKLPALSRGILHGEVCHVRGSAGLAVLSNTVDHLPAILKPQWGHAGQVSRIRKGLAYRGAVP